MDTPQLIDGGEEHWRGKLHVGCGGVYLRGYINVDVQGVLSGEVGAALVADLVTDIGHYYREDGPWHNLPARRPTVCDMRCNLTELDAVFAKESLDKIVAVQVLEHLDPIDFVGALDQFHGLLHAGGVVLVSVPDMDGSLAWLADPERVGFIARHLRGTGKDRWSWHKSWWTRDSLRKALEWVGFREVTELANFHSYPSVVMRGAKGG